MSLLLLAMEGLARAQEVIPDLGAAVTSVVSGAEGDEVSTAVRLLVLLTALSFLPAVLLLMTPFTRFVIVLSMMRQALGLQQSPPNQVLVGLSLILSLLVMQPTLDEVENSALEPFLSGQMETGDAVSAGLAPLRRFMLSHTRRDDLAASMRLAKVPRPHSLEEIPSTVVITGFVLSELRTAFDIAVRVYIPFLVVDLVVASVLLGMGMMMLPPVVISLPFKLLIFVLMDGWTLLITGLAGGFA
ncbi:MAG: flagellar type III secretion system pore protein FliP [Deltaproteobacteria bacterium]|nr:flagellar type III secretion system pore protein FliP [Deltaproteobacteria bacterium]